MVAVDSVELFSDGSESTSGFPDEELSRIRSEIEEVPDEMFDRTGKGEEVSKFDAELARNLTGYRSEGSGHCQLWNDEDFRHSVDLYHPEERIAVEVEKSERKYVWRDLVKFNRGGKTYDEGRRKIEFGCLIVPVNYRGSRNIATAASNALEFMRPSMFVDDVAVVGYRVPGWE